MKTEMRIYEKGLLIELMKDKHSCLILKSCSRKIELQPKYLKQVKLGIKEALDQCLNRYDYRLNGILLDYQNLSFMVDNNSGKIVGKCGEFVVSIKAEFFVFQPEIGNLLKGVVNVKSDSHVGCLVHKRFNAMILKPENVEIENWNCKNIQIGDEIVFEIADHVFSGHVPFIEGKISGEYLEKKLRKQLKKSRRTASLIEHSQHNGLCCEGDISKNEERTVPEIDEKNFFNCILETKTVQEVEGAPNISPKKKKSGLKTEKEIDPASNEQNSQKKKRKKDKDRHEQKHKGRNENKHKHKDEEGDKHKDEDQDKTIVKDKEKDRHEQKHKGRNENKHKHKDEEGDKHKDEDQDETIVKDKEKDRHEQKHKGRNENKHKHKDEEGDKHKDEDQDETIVKDKEKDRHEQKHKGRNENKHKHKDEEGDKHKDEDQDESTVKDKEKEKENTKKKLEKSKLFTTKEDEIKSHSVESTPTKNKRRKLGSGSQILLEKSLKPESYSSVMTTDIDGKRYVKAVDSESGAKEAAVCITDTLTQKRVEEEPVLRTPDTSTRKRAGEKLKKTPAKKSKFEIDVGLKQHVIDDMLQSKRVPAEEKFDKPVTTSTPKLLDNSSQNTDKKDSCMISTPNSVVNSAINKDKKKKSSKNKSQLNSHKSENEDERKSLINALLDSVKLTLGIKDITAEKSSKSETKKKVEDPIFQWLRKSVDKSTQKVQNSFKGDTSRLSSADSGFNSVADRSKI